jgi:hypothetical protein
LAYILTDRETELLVRMQATCRGMVTRHKMRKQWLAIYSDGSEARKRRAIRMLYLASLLIGSIQMHRARYARRLRRIQRKAAKVAAGEDDEEEILPFPPWFKYVAWGSSITWCIICGLYTMILGIYFGPAATLDWLFGSIGAMTWEGVVQDNFKIMITVLLSDQAEFLVDFYYVRACAPLSSASSLLRRGARCL